MHNELNLNINNQQHEECDECPVKGMCSINPGLSSLHQVILLHLKEIAFYLLKLKDFGCTNNKIKETVIEALSGILANIDYTQPQFQKLISDLDEDIRQTKFLYQKFCEEKNVSLETLKTYFKHSKEINLSDATKKGEKYSLKKSGTLTNRQKDLYDIMLFLIKSMCIKIIELNRLGEENDDDSYYYSILSMLNIMNLSSFSEEKIKDEIKEVIRNYYKLVTDVFHSQIEKYGAITPTEVSFSTKPGKAILVSGSDFKKLENVLKAAEKTEISVYTHGPEMLFAHTFPKLKTHPNLKGHFGSESGAIVDFAEFPGPILMTKLSLQNYSALYRGRLFTLDPIAPQGIIKIKDHNYEPLINSALESSGFVHGREKPNVKVGYSSSEIETKTNEIAEKIINKSIKHLFIIGLFNYPNTCAKYFETFFKLLPKDCYAISLSCDVKKDNVFHVASFHEYSLLFKILKDLNEKIPLNEINMTVFVTKCDKHTIANLLHLKEIGIKNIYMCKCPSMLINPALIETIHEIYGIKEFSSPKADIENSLKSNK